MINFKFTIKATLRIVKSSRINENKTSFKPEKQGKIFINTKDMCNLRPHIKPYFVKSMLYKINILVM